MIIGRHNDSVVKCNLLYVLELNARDVWLAISATLYVFKTGDICVDWKCTRAERLKQKLITHALEYRFQFMKIIWPLVQIETHRSDIFRRLIWKLKSFQRDIIVVLSICIFTDSVEA